MTSNEPAAVSLDPGHGHSVAGWTAVGIMLVGFAVGCFAMVLASKVGFVVGAVIVLLGVVTWKVLDTMGYGPKPHS